MKIVVSSLPKDVQSTHVQSRKVKLSDFTDPVTTKLAKAGHCAMCHYVATTEAFPLPVHKEEQELSWTCLVKGAEEKEEMIANLEAVEKDLLLKSQLIDYVCA